MAVDITLIDERDIRWDLNPTHYRAYLVDDARHEVSAYDLSTTDVTEALAESKRLAKPGRRLALAAIVVHGDERGAVFIVGSDPGRGT